jgi:hypothetical protein
MGRQHYVEFEETSTFEMEGIVFSETPVTIYKITQRNTTQD